MRMTAAEPSMNKINIKDFMPKDIASEAKNLAALKKKKQTSEGEWADNEMELILEDDSSEKEEPEPDPALIKAEEEEYERQVEAQRQQAILAKETCIVKTELEELIF